MTTTDLQEQIDLLHASLGEKNAEIIPFGRLKADELKGHFDFINEEYRNIFMSFIELITDGVTSGNTFLTVDDIALIATATGAGKALKAKSTYGLSAHMIGQQLIEHSETGTYTDDALFEVNATTLGSLPCPRVTTDEKLNINAVTPGLKVYDKNYKRYEYWNGAYWAGHRQTINIFFGGWSNPANSQTVAFGAMPISPQASGGVYAAFDIIARGNGVVRACTFNIWYTGTPATGEAISLYIRHNTTDYLVATVANTLSIKVFENALMNIPYVDGDRFKMIIVNPASGTRGTQLLGQGTFTTE